MARLALTIAGAIAGAAIAYFSMGTATAAGIQLGLSIGALAGSIAGQLAFPGQGTHVYGPRVNDMQVSSSAPGTVIPLVYGSMRMGGQIIWSGGIDEVTTNNKQSAKGGPSVTQTTYTYFCSFGAAFCQGPANITRIWGDSKLIYDGGSSSYRGVWSNATAYNTGDVVLVGSTYYQALHPSTDINPSAGTFFGDILGDLMWATCAAPANPGSVASNINVIPTLYTGSETQLQDPLMVAHDGAGAVPAYRGTCYAVWEKFPLVNFGNRLPNIRAEVHANAVSAPATVTIDYEDNTSGPYAAAMSPDGKTAWFASLVETGPMPYVQKIDMISGTVTAQGHVTGFANDTSNYLINTGQSNMIADANGYLYMGGLYNGHGAVYKIDGSTFQVVGHWRGFYLDTDGVHSTGTSYFGPQSMSLDASGNYLVCTSGASVFLGLSGSNIVMWFIDTASMQSVGQYPFASVGSKCLAQMHPIVDENNNVYLLVLNGSAFGVPDNSGWSVIKINTSAGVTHFDNPAPSGFNTDCGIYMNAAPCLTGGAGAMPGGLLYDQDDASLILFFNDGHITKYDLATGTQIAATPAGQFYTSSGSIGGGSYLAYSSGNFGDSATNNYCQIACGGKARNGFVFTSGANVGTFQNVRKWNASTLELLAEYPILSTFPHMSTGFEVNSYWFYDFSSDSLVLTVFNANQLNYPTYTPWKQCVYRLYLDRLLGSGETAASIVLDICTRAGIDPSNIDVSLIDNITVTGYPIPQLQTGKDMINNLAQVYFFEGRETDFKLQFVPKGQTPVATLLESELGLVDDKCSIIETIGQEQDLPKEVEVIYIDQEQDYQQNAQKKIRHHKIRKTVNKTSISVPIVLTARQAEQLAERLLWTSDQERRSYKTNLWKAYWILLDPCDVINFNYNGVLLTGRCCMVTIGQNQAVALEMIAEDSNSYLAVSSGSGGSGFVGQTIAGLASTILWLLDMPYLRDTDADATGNSGFYAVLAPSSGGSWPAGLLFKSNDGQTWDQIDASTTKPTYGSCTTALGAPANSPYVWDYKNSVTVRLNIGDAPTSDTMLNVLNGSNGVVLFPSLEVIQFTTAVDNGDGTYTLSGLLRGRRGTEWACGNHTIGEIAFFANLGGILHEQVALTNVGSGRTFKGVTAGEDISTGTPQNKTLIGRDLMPYAPSHLQGTIDGSSNINLTWVRRTRLGGDWLNGFNTPGTYETLEPGMPVPLNESTESYDIVILDGSGNIMRTVAGLSSPAYQYTAAQQTADFGSHQTTLRVQVYQNSAQVGRGFVTDVPNVMAP